MSGVSGDFPIGRPSVCCGVVMPVCLCVVLFSKFHEHDTHDLLRTRPTILTYRDGLATSNGVTAPHASPGIRS